MNKIRPDLPIGNKLKGLRERNTNYFQNDIVLLLKQKNIFLSQSTFSKIENNIRNIDINILCELCELYKTDYNKLFFELHEDFISSSEGFTSFGKREFIDITKFPNLCPVKTLGHCIQSIRKIRILTQESVVIQLNLMGYSISRSLYAQLETDRVNFTVSLLMALSIILDVDYNSFFQNIDYKC